MGAWRTFAAANPSKDWQAWHGPVFGKDYAWFGRFYGNDAGFVEFKQLADSLYSVIRQIDPRWDTIEESRPIGVSPGGFEQCLDLLHQIAVHWPTPLIRSTESRWGLGEEHERKKEAIDADYADDKELTAEDPQKLDELDALEESLAEAENGMAYMVHPWVNTIDNNLFSAFASLIDMMLDDDKAFFISKGHFFEPDYPRLGRSELTAENDLLRGSGPKGIPIVRSVTIEKGLEGYYLDAPHGKFSIDPDSEREWLLLPFLARIARDNPGEIVRWAELNVRLGDDTETKRAGRQVRRTLLSLRKELNEWGRPPKGEHWIKTAKKMGLQLNDSCEWNIHPGLKRSLGRKSQSVHGISTDPFIQARNTADD